MILFRQYYLGIIEDHQSYLLEYANRIEGYCGTGVPPNLGKNFFVNHRKGVNKALEVVLNDHVQQYGIKGIRLIRVCAPLKQSWPP